MVPFVGPDLAKSAFHLAVLINLALLNGKWRQTYQYNVISTFLIGISGNSDISLCHGSGRNIQSAFQ